MTFRKPVCVHTCVCGSVYVCVPVHATASMWSEHSLGCLFLPPTVLEKGSYVVHCCIHRARWSVSIMSPPPTSPVSTILWCTPHYHSCLYVFCFFFLNSVSHILEPSLQPKPNILPCTCHEMISMPPLPTLPCLFF